MHIGSGEKKMLCTLIDLFLLPTEYRHVISTSQPGEGRKNLSHARDSSQLPQRLIWVSNNLGTQPERQFRTWYSSAVEHTLGMQKSLVQFPPVSPLSCTEGRCCEPLQLDEVPLSVSASLSWQYWPQKTNDLHGSFLWQTNTKWSQQQQDSTPFDRLHTQFQNIVIPTDAIKRGHIFKPKPPKAYRSRGSG